MPEPTDRSAFAERMRLQLRSRYRGVEVTVDPAGFALRLRGPGVDASLPLGPLHQACRREPQRSAGLIADFVRGAERQLSPRSASDIRPGRLLWCVRGERYLEGLNRAPDLVTRPLGAGMVAFVAEALPGSLMRGAAIQDLVAAGLDQGQAGARADANTQERFAALPPRILATERVPADGWRLSSDTLFQGSALMVPEVLAAFARRCGGEVLLAVPDRGEMLAVPAGLPSVDRFRMRVLRAWREAMNPVSREILISDGRSLRVVEPRARRQAFELLGWLRA